MAKSSRITTGLVLQVIVALFLITLGLYGIMNYDSTRNELLRSLNKIFGKGTNPMNIIMAIFEIVAGAVLILVIFAPVKKNLLFIVTIIITVLWGVQIVLTFFAENIFEPDFVVWLNRLCIDLMVLTVLWSVGRRFS